MDKTYVKRMKMYICVSDSFSKIHLIDDDGVWHGVRRFLMFFFIQFWIFSVVHIYLNTFLLFSLLLPNKLTHNEQLKNKK